MFGTYEQLASEYYDSSRHPTCANFREGSILLLHSWLRKLLPVRGRFCEVGCGMSVGAELLAGNGAALDRLTLVDSSRSMLGHSRKYANLGAQLLVGDAFLLPLPSQSFDFVLSSLCDPYNKLSFWKEVHRILLPDGIAFITTPSYDWAAAFRRSSEYARQSAEFELSDGRRLHVPSWIYPKDVQRKLIEESGLLVKEVVDVAISALKSERLSPKLVLERGSGASMVTGFLLRKACRSRSLIDGNATPEV